MGPVTVLEAPVAPVGPGTLLGAVLAAPVCPVAPVGPLGPVCPVCPVCPIGPVGPPCGPVGPVCPQTVDDLIADHGPSPALVFARTLKKYCVMGARPYAVKDVTSGEIFAEA